MPETKQFGDAIRSSVISLEDTFVGGIHAGAAVLVMSRKLS
jgi:hypothetical protein